MNNTFSLRGININNIAIIKNAIDQYKNVLIKATAISASKSNVEKAIKGTNVEAQIKIISDVIDAKITNMFQELDKFKSVLDEVVIAYKKQDTSSNIASGATSIIKS